MRSPSPPPVSLDPYVDGYIVEAAWNVMQPTQGAFVTTRIDKAVAAVRKWNAANPNNQRGHSAAHYRRVQHARRGRSTSVVPAVHLCSNSGTCGMRRGGGPHPVQAAYAAYTAEACAPT